MRRLLRLVLCALVAICAGPVRADEKNSASVGLGFRHVQVREDLLRPLRWGGPGGELRTEYSRAQARFRADAQLGLGAAYVRNRYEHDALPLSFDLRAAYARRVLTWQGHHQIFVGATLVNQHSPIYFRSWDEEHLYWGLNYDLGPVLRYEMAMPRLGLLTAEVSSPVLGFVSRPPERRVSKIEDLPHFGFWWSAPHRRLEVASLDRYAGLRARVRYTKKFARRTAFRASYELGYRRFREPAMLALLEQVFLVESVFGW